MRSPDPAPHDAARRRSRSAAVVRRRRARARAPGRARHRVRHGAPARQRHRLRRRDRQPALDRQDRRGADRRHAPARHAQGLHLGRGLEPDVRVRRPHAARRSATIPMGPAPHHLLASHNGRPHLRRRVRPEHGRRRRHRAPTPRSPTSSPARCRTRARTPSSSPATARTSTRPTRARSAPSEATSATSTLAAASCCATREVGIDPSEILVTPDGRRGYVSVRGENKVKELDLRGDCPRADRSRGGRRHPAGHAPADRRRRHARRDPARHAGADLAARHAHVHAAARGHPGPHHDRPPLALAQRRVQLRRGREPRRAGRRRQRHRPVVADYPYPNPPGGNRPHGVFFAPQHGRCSR